MSLAVLCAPCEMGDHDRHDARGTTRPGLIGGHYCPCPGGCEPHSNPVLDAMLARVTSPGGGRPCSCGIAVVGAQTGHGPEVITHRAYPDDCRVTSPGGSDA